jgi:hypothetical protein
MQAHLASLLFRRVCPFDAQGSGLHAFNVLSQLNPRRRQFARELLMLGFPQTYRQAVTYRCVCPEPIAGAHRSPTQFAPQAQREDGARVPPPPFDAAIFLLSSDESPGGNIPLRLPGADRRHPSLAHPACTTDATRGRRKGSPIGLSMQHFCLSLELDDVLVEKSCYFLPAICKANPHLRHVQ